MQPIRNNIHCRDNEITNIIIASSCFHLWAAAVPCWRHQQVCVFACRPKWPNWNILDGKTLKEEGGKTNFPVKNNFSAGKKETLRQGGTPSTPSLPPLLIWVEKSLRCHKIISLFTNYISMEKATTTSQPPQQQNISLFRIGRWIDTWIYMKK